MTPPRVLLFFFVLAAALIAAGLPVANAGEINRPNVLLIADDDLRPGPTAAPTSRARTSIDWPGTFRRAYVQQAVLAVAFERPDEHAAGHHEGMGIPRTHFRPALPDVVTRCR